MDAFYVHSPARDKLKWGSPQTGSSQERDTISAVKDGASEDKRTQQGRWVRSRNSSRTKQSVFLPIFLHKYSHLFPLAASMQWTTWPNTRSSCRIRAASRKKAASLTWVLKSNGDFWGFVVWSNHFQRWRSFFFFFFVVLFCSLKERPRSACQFSTSVTLSWAVGFSDWPLRCPILELFSLCE